MEQNNKKISCNNCKYFNKENYNVCDYTNFITLPNNWCFAFIRKVTNYEEAQEK